MRAHVAHSLRSSGLVAASLVALAAACGSSGDSGTSGPGDGSADSSPDVSTGSDGSQGLDATGGMDATQGSDGSGEAGADGGAGEAAAEAGDEGGSREGGHEGGPVDSGGDHHVKDGGDGGFVMAAHPALPKVIFNDYGGPKGSGVLTAPKVVTITFAGDPYQTPLEALGNTYASSSMWDKIKPGFCDPDGTTCLGDGPPGVAVHLGAQPSTDAKTFSGKDLETWLVDQLTAGALPAPDGANPTNTIYSIVLQEGFKMPGLCTGFLGYHSAVKYKGQWVVYALSGECRPFSGMSTLDLTAQTINHEISEASTDPFNGYDLDYGDFDNQGWLGALGGGEVGDLCDWYGPAPDYSYWPGENVEYQAGSTTLHPQRIWSPVAAAAGGDPCLPIPPGVVFFEVAPTQQVYVLDVGTSVTFDAYAYSTAPVADWTLLAAYDPSVLDIQIAGATAGDGGAPALKVNNGDRPSITVTLLKDPGKFNDAGVLQRGSPAIGVLHSYSGSTKRPTAAYEWGFAVVTPADATKDRIDSGLSKRPEEQLREELELPPGARGIRWVRSGGPHSR